MLKREAAPAAMPVSISRSKKGACVCVVSCVRLVVGRLVVDISINIPTRVCMEMRYTSTTSKRTNPP